MFYTCRVEDIIQGFINSTDASPDLKRQKLDAPTTGAASTAINNSDNAHVKYIRYYREGQRVILQEVISDLEAILDMTGSEEEGREDMEGLMKFEKNG